ncbi:hypothetical protein ACHAWX_004156 [Stephanocyclus meneghinianus]
MSTSTFSASSTPKTIAITGGLGNLGTKLCYHLLATTTHKIILLEHPSYISETKAAALQRNPSVTIIPIDLGQPSSIKILEVLKDVDAVVHFSAVNPYPNATWSESAQSMDHTFMIFQAAVMHRVRRVIFASSNHVMGGYKDDPLFGPSSITPSSDPRVGTIPLDPKTLAISGDAMGYAAAKLAGERLAMTLASVYGDTTSFVVLRIGWCQPGENLPSTLSAAGSPPEFLMEGDGEAGAQEQSEGDKKDEVWFKQMWLSNRDFLSYFQKALELTIPTNDTTEGAAGVHANVRKGFLLLNAMSANSGAKWNLEETQKWLGVISSDDSFQ